MAAVFAARPHTKGPHRTKSLYRTRVFSPGAEVKIEVVFKHSRIKQYLKQGRAYRIETVINKPADLGVLARIEHLPELVAKARAVNHRLLMIERAGQGCAIGSALFVRTHQPCNREGQRTGALRFGDHRAMALAGALCLTDVVRPPAAEYVPKTARVSEIGEVSGSSRHRLQDGCSAN